MFHENLQLEFELEIDRVVLLWKRRAVCRRLQDFTIIESLFGDIPHYY
jgi:hypothetical protein